MLISVIARVCVYVSPQLLAEQYLHSIAMAHHGLKYAAFPHFMVECHERRALCELSNGIAGVGATGTSGKLFGGVGLGGSNANQSMVGCWLTDS
jgi:hypothetical protein